jgi:outer membrane protein assembly factor BamB
MFRGGPARTGCFAGGSSPAGAGFGGWTVELGTTFRSCPAVVDDVVYIASLDVVHAVDAHSGARKWSYRTGGGVDSSPSVLDDVSTCCRPPTVR